MFTDERPSGAKARGHFAGMMYGLKPVPFTALILCVTKTPGARP